ncbi:MAG: hypothetical protein ACRBBP_09160 [Bdellovibrionales bacterium]
MDSDPQLGVEKSALMKRVEVAKVQIQANEDIVDVFAQIRTGVRQIGSLFGTQSSTYTPFDTVKNIFEDFGGGIPEIEEKNQYVIRKSIKISNTSDSCKEFDVYAMLVDQKVDEKTLDVEGQELSYAIQGCDITEKTKILGLSWSKDGISFRVESETIKRLIDPRKYEEGIKNSLEQEVEELAADLECQTQGRVFEEFQFSCQNIVIKVYEDEYSDYAHSILLNEITYNSETYIRFEANGTNLVRLHEQWVYDEELGESVRKPPVVNKESISIKIYEDGDIDHKLEAFIEAVKDNPEIEGELDKVEDVADEVKGALNSVSGEKG